MPFEAVTMKGKISLFNLSSLPLGAGFRSALSVLFPVRQMFCRSLKRKSQKAQFKNTHRVIFHWLSVLMVVYHLHRKTGWSIVVLDGHVKSQVEIITGMPCFHFHDFFSDDRIKGMQSKTKGPELVKTSKWNAHFLFRNSVWESWSTFQDIPFSRENFRSGRQN